MRLSLPLALALGLAAAGTATAGDPAAWDDSHMRSNFAHQRGPAPPRPAVQGADRYHQANEAPTETPPISVAETTLTVSPHEWTPGGPSVSRGDATPPWASPGNAVSSGGARASASSGLRNSATRSTGGSALRSSKLGRQRHHR